jgi:hypothetical protein
MIEEAYVSFEVAKLLKEKGFDEKCRGGYHSEFDNNDNPIVILEEWIAQPYNNDFVDEGFLCSAPTHQMAMAWLREEYDFHIIVYPWKANNKKKWVCKVYRTFNLLGCERYSNETLDSYEEAVEAALKYVLENLI